MLHSNLFTIFKKYYLKYTSRKWKYLKLVAKYLNKGYGLSLQLFPLSQLINKSLSRWGRLSCSAALKVWSPSRLHRARVAFKPECDHACSEGQNLSWFCCVPANVLGCLLVGAVDQEDRMVSRDVAAREGWMEPDPDGPQSRVQGHEQDQELLWEANLGRAYVLLLTCLINYWYICSWTNSI